MGAPMGVPPPGGMSGAPRALPGGNLPPHLQTEREGGKFGGYGNYGAGASKEVRDKFYFYTENKTSKT